MSRPALKSAALSPAEREIDEGRRFSFGRNWQSFLETLDDSRIQIACGSLTELLGVASLQGKTFLDIGSGSGLFSLAARMLGAKVHSFDFDPSSVACTEELRHRFFPEDADWVIESGSALDFEYLESLGTFDVVYSWGVLHHTGNMWQALANAEISVAHGGQLAIALYNDQGWRSRIWLRVKQCYCSGTMGRIIVSAVYLPWFFARTVGKCLITRKNEFREYRRNRGMSIVHDWIDWLGGLPFEVARPAEIEEFYQQRGFRLESIRRTRRLGCNEFVFRRETKE